MGSNDLIRSGNIFSRLVSLDTVQYPKDPSVALGFQSALGGSLDKYV